MARTKAKKTGNTGQEEAGVRLQKVLAQAGVASRRASEEIIEAGRVRVNGRKVTRLGSRVDPDKDVIEVDGARLKPPPKRYLAVNKPRGVICSRQDERGRIVVGELIPQQWSDVYSVGRLDRDTEGLLFLTNDGDFCLKVTHPRYRVRKRYRVELRGRITPKHVRAMLQGVEDEGEFLQAAEIKTLVSDTTGSLIEMDLYEGKNREVRRLLGSQELRIHLLRRIQIGPIKLADLRLGRWRTLNEGEVAGFMKAPVG